MDKMGKINYLVGIELSNEQNRDYGIKRLSKLTLQFKGQRRYNRPSQKKDFQACFKEQKKAIGFLEKALSNTFAKKGCIIID